MKRNPNRSREAADAQLDRRLEDIFDDRRTPGAPDTLYEFLREVPMTSETPNDRTIRRWWTGLGRGARVMASLAAVAVIAALVVVAVLGPHGDGVGSQGSQMPAGPTAPPAPAGWHQVASVGSRDDGGGIPVGIYFTDPQPGPSSTVVALHVVCTGPDELVVMIGYGPDPAPAYGVAVQATRVGCEMTDTGSDTRVVFTSPDKPFTWVQGVIVRHPASLRNDSWVVSVEAPDASETPTPTAGPTR